MLRPCVGAPFSSFLLCFGLSPHERRQQSFTSPPRLWRTTAYPLPPPSRQQRYSRSSSPPHAQSVHLPPPARRQPESRRPRVRSCPAAGAGFSLNPLRRFYYTKGAATPSALPPAPEAASAAAPAATEAAAARCKSGESTPLLPGGNRPSPVLETGTPRAASCARGWRCSAPHPLASAARRPRRRNPDSPCRTPAAKTPIQKHALRGSATPALQRLYEAAHVSGGARVSIYPRINPGGARTCSGVRVARLNQVTL